MGKLTTSKSIQILTALDSILTHTEIISCVGSKDTVSPATFSKVADNQLGDYFKATKMNPPL